jgi:hypothetical protein
MNAAIIENIIRALVSSLPDDYFKQEIERRSLTTEVSDKVDFVHKNLNLLDTECLWDAIPASDQREMVLGNLDLIDDDDLFDAISDKAQMLRDNISGELDDDELIDLMDDPERTIASFVSGADRSTVRRIIGKISDESLAEAFSDTLSVACSAVEKLTHIEMLEVLDHCGETNTTALLREHLKVQGTLQHFLVSQDSTDLYSALKEKSDSPVLSAEDFIASIPASNFTVAETVNIMHALLKTL